jgi:hypothetical protein
MVNAVSDMPLHGNTETRALTGSHRDYCSRMQRAATNCTRFVRLRFAHVFHARRYRELLSCLIEKSSLRA